MPYYKEPFTFNFDDQQIAIDSGVEAVDCAALYDGIKEAQASEEGIIYNRIGSGSGLDSLGAGVQTGLTVALLGSWQLLFPTGNYIATIAGGNLVGGPNGDPVAYSAGVQTLLIQSANSTVVSASGSNPDIAAIKERTDRLPDAPAAEGTVEEAVKQARIAVAVSS